MSTPVEAAGTPEAAPRWKPVSAIDRRVLGVLVEKAKTTPDTYPLSLNALVTGCNQKNNRYPLTQYEPDAVEASLDRLRMLGAVAAVQGSGRVGKYRHYMYEWLGVDKLELAVMAELLLRGAQTEGELRGRAARMDPIADLAALRPIMDSLKSKGLVQALTPEGRGQIISHALYLPEEMDKVRRQVGEMGVSATHVSAEPAHHAPPPRNEPATAHVAPHTAASSAPAVSGASASEFAALRRELDELRGTVTELRADLDEVTELAGRNEEELRQLRQSLGG